MSTTYKYRPVTTNITVDYWDKILDVQAPGLTLTMPAVDDLSLKNGGWFLFIGTTNPYDLTTIDGSTFAENGLNTLTVSDGEMYELIYVNNQWWKRPLPGSAGSPTEILDLGNLDYMANPNNGSPPVAWNTSVPIQNMIFVAKNGNDATAVPGDLKRPYLTIEAAHAASTPNDTVHVFAGKYTFTTSLLFDGTHARKVYMHPGVTITSLNIDYTFKISPLETMQILGYADFNIKFPLFANIGFTTDIAFIEFEFNKMINDSAGLSYQGVDLTSLKGSMRGRTINDIFFDCTSWKQIELQVDEWLVDQSSMLDFDDPTTNNGSTYLTQYGTSTFKLSGFSQPLAKLNKPTVGVSAQPFIKISQGGTIYDQLIEIFANIYSYDGPAFLHGGGTLRWTGDGFHHKSNTLGNEMPFYATQTPGVGGQRSKMQMEHWGTLVMALNATHPYLNSTLIDIRHSGNFIWHGKYKARGFDELAIGTPFPCISVQNTDVDGEINVIFDGVWEVAQDATVGPIRLSGLGNDANKIIPIFLNNIVICPSDEKIVEPIWSSTGETIGLYVIHSLAINHAINDDVFPNLMSVDRMYVDTDLQYPIPEYLG